MESSLNAAREALVETINSLAAVPRANSNEPVTLKAITPYMQTFETTFGREVGTSIHSPSFA
jgi:hypothetical protein